MRSESRKHNIRTYQCWKRAIRVCQFALIGALLYQAWESVANPSVFAADISADMGFSTTIALDPVTSTILIVIMALVSALSLLGLQCVWCFFEQVESERSISPETATYLRQSGVYAVASCTLGILTQQGSTLFATLENPGTGHISYFDISSLLLVLLPAAGLLFVIGHILTIASGFRQNNQGTA